MPQQRDARHTEPTRKASGSVQPTAPSGKQNAKPAGHRVRAHNNTAVTVSDAWEGCLFHHAAGRVGWAGAMT